MKLLAFAASNSSQSINRKLIDYAIGLLTDGQIEGVPGGSVQVTTLDLADFEMPIYSLDRQDGNGIPQLAQDFLDMVCAADALLISFAEHNASYATAFKNVYDWASRIDMQVYQGRPIVMLATSPGGGGARFVLQAASTIAGHFGSDVLATLSVPRFGENFDAEAGALSDPALDAELRDALASLSRVLEGSAEAEA